jgi:hypothetical protein
MHAPAPPPEPGIAARSSTTTNRPQRRRHPSKAFPMPHCPHVTTLPIVRTLLSSMSPCYLHFTTLPVPRLALPCTCSLARAYCSSKGWAVRLENLKVSRWLGIYDITKLLQMLMEKMRGCQAFSVCFVLYSCMSFWVHCVLSTYDTIYNV